MIVALLKAATNRVADDESETRAGADRFCPEKRFEEMRLNV
jgi:hypothetical protein